jgi:hypothetical protein
MKLKIFYTRKEKEKSKGKKKHWNSATELMI